VTGSHVLLAVGRKPNTDDLGLDKAGVEIDKRGYVSSTTSCAQQCPGIWAMGDCNGKGAFTHTAYNDFEIIAANLLDNDPAARSATASLLRPVHRPAAGPLSA
jgi:pyruvate/2-oxoglutarate dehydrogenase complex dihydrolipoamide dehydrogenase (E3) component